MFTEQRGHHKKKKVHKEIKKIVIKIIIAIALLILKKKAILGMIQTMIITKFILVATIYVFTLAFKIWWEIKQHKLHQHDKSVIYYDNEHHGHHYDLPEHGEYDDHHEHFSGHEHPFAAVTNGWNLWGRSYAPPPSTQATPVIPSSYYHKPLPYYIRPKLNYQPTTEEDEFS